MRITKNPTRSVLLKNPLNQDCTVQKQYNRQHDLVFLSRSLKLATIKIFYFPRCVRPRIKWQMAKRPCGGDIGLLLITI